MCVRSDFKFDMIYVRQVIASISIVFLVYCFMFPIKFVFDGSWSLPEILSEKHKHTLCVQTPAHTTVATLTQEWCCFSVGRIFVGTQHTHPYTGAACSRIDQELKLLTRCERSRVIFRIHSQWLMRCVIALLNEVERVNHDNIQEESKFARFYACHAHLNSSRPKMKKTKAANWLFSSCNFAPRKNVQCSWCSVAATRAGISVVFASFFLHWP